MTPSTNTLDNSIDFMAIGRELTGGKASNISKNLSKSQSHFSDGSELAPAEAIARMNREGDSFLSLPNTMGATVDQEGLANNYAVMPQVYLADFPSPEQARKYAFQGAFALLFFASLIFTAFAVS
jgi:hypothetical protein